MQLTRHNVFSALTSTKMFATLKNKIKEETGNDVPTLPARTSQNRYQRGTLDSTSSVSIESLSMFEQVRVYYVNLLFSWQWNNKNCIVSFYRKKQSYVHFEHNSTISIVNTMTCRKGTISCRTMWKD